MVLQGTQRTSNCMHVVLSDLKYDKTTLYALNIRVALEFHCPYIYIPLVIYWMGGPYWISAIMNCHLVYPREKSKRRLIGLYHWPTINSACPKYNKVGTFEYFKVAINCSSYDCIFFSVAIYSGVRPQSVSHLPENLNCLVAELKAK